MDLDKLAASAHTALTHYNRTRGRRRRTREKAADVFLADIRHAAGQLNQADLAGAVAQERKITHLERELHGMQGIAEELREQLTGARGELATTAGDLAEAQARIAGLEQAARDHLCEPLPQRVRPPRDLGPQWQTPPPVPTAAPEVAPDGSGSPPKPRTRRTPSTGTPHPAGKPTSEGAA